MPREVKPRTRAEVPSVPDKSGLDEFAPETTSNPSAQRVVKPLATDFGPGWSADKHAPVYKSSGTSEKFSAPDNGQEVLVKFTSETPFLSFFQHWIMQEDGKRHPYAHGGEECPLCAYGDRAKSVDYFNIIELGEDGSAALKLWIATPDPGKAIREKAQSKRTSPLNREDLYFAVSKRRGTNNVYSYTVEKVSASELEAEWGVTPLTQEQVEKCLEGAYDSSVAENQRKSHAELLEIAKKYLGE